jgi:hypothetical protein
MTLGVLVLHRSNQTVHELLAPYDLNLESPPRDKPCICISLAKRQRAAAQASSAIGVTFQQLQRQYREEHPEDRAQPSEGWKAFSLPWWRAFADALQADTEPEAPDPECDLCGGTGSFQTILNPNGKWDWYRVGGRYQGALTGFDPEEDPDNWETCSRCNGTGQSADTASEDPCGSCQGQGRRLKDFPCWKPYAGDSIPAATVRPDFVSFAVVTPLAEWYEVEERPFWDPRHKDVEEAWKSQVRTLMQQYRDCFATILDCHR